MIADASGKSPDNRIMYYTREPAQAQLKILEKRPGNFKASPHNCVCGLRPIFCPIRAVIKGGNTYSIPAHTVFPPFYNFRMRQNLRPNALAKLCGAALNFLLTNSWAEDIIYRHSEMRECWNGRQARLRCVCPMAWEFESPLSHQNRQVLRDLPIFCVRTTRNNSGCTHRGGYQPPEQALDSRRAPAAPRRAACPHAAMTGPR